MGATCCVAKGPPGSPSKNSLACVVPGGRLVITQQNVHYLKWHIRVTDRDKMFPDASSAERSPNSIISFLEKRGSAMSPDCWESPNARMNACDACAAKFHLRSQDSGKEVATRGPCQASAGADNQEASCTASHDQRFTDSIVDQKPLGRKHTVRRKELTHDLTKPLESNENTPTVDNPRGNVPPDFFDSWSNEQGLLHQNPAVRACRRKSTASLEVPSYPFATETPVSPRDSIIDPYLRSAARRLTRTTDDSPATSSRLPEFTENSKLQFECQEPSVIQSLSG